MSFECKLHPTLITEHEWPEGTVPLVSIHCITFNHSAFIRDALEGFLMQETTFPVEILIHDDASTDGTADIIREYEMRFPRLVKPIYQVENQYSKGGKPGRINMERALGEYIACCEGDDFWSDPLKTQKQVELMKENPDVTICATLTRQVRAGDEKNTMFFVRPEIRKDFYSIEDVIVDDFMQTCSLVVKRVALPSFDEFRGIVNGDYVLKVGACYPGVAAFLWDDCAVYRMHDGGVWSGASPEYQVLENWKTSSALNRWTKGNFIQSFRERFLKYADYGIQRLANEGEVGRAGWLMTRCFIISFPWGSSHLLRYPYRLFRAGMKKYIKRARRFFQRGETEASR
jgi:glycosyltransferase involved in cell wall biosynthesis